MKIYSINAGYFKLDGGAMFGVVPKSLWNRLNPADENNMCSWAMRLVLIDTGDRKILIDSGMGDKQNEKFFSFYYLHGDDSIEKNLSKHGYSFDDITDNLITHLHFDHCGGSIKWNKDKTELIPAFPNATFHVSSEQWKSAMDPNPREKASFLEENIAPMKESGKLNLIDPSQAGEEILPGISVQFVYGHTTGMMIPLIDYNGQKIAFCADLLPSSYHLKSAYVMGYDIRPLNTMNETQNFLAQAEANNWILFFEHDPKVECCTIEKGKKGFQVKETMTLEEL